ncbi:MAG: NUDIX hydrolase [Candidatus Taylorbacteria bacterium]|nr:NUDIX hydrolase [Candidatus Taylorbacteria bacterium]
MRSIDRDIVSALIFSKDGRLFQGMKAKGKGGVYSDCWHIPGGGMDDGEGQEDALVREIREETGIDISSYKIELLDDSGRGESEKILKDTGEKVLCKMRFNVYKIVINDKNADEIEVNLNDDLVEYQWINLQDLGKIKLTPPSVKLFKKLGYID